MWWFKSALVTENNQKSLISHDHTRLYLKNILEEMAENHRKVAHLNDWCILREQQIFCGKMSAIISWERNTVDLTSFIHEMCFHISWKVSGLIKAFKADGYIDSVIMFAENNTKSKTFKASDIVEIFWDVNLLSSLSDSALHVILNDLSFSEAWIQNQDFRWSSFEKLLLKIKEIGKLYILNEVFFGELLYWMVDGYEQIEKAKGFIRFIKSEGFNYTTSPAFLDHLHQRLSIEWQEELGFLFINIIEPQKILTR